MFNHYYNTNVAKCRIRKLLPNCIEKIDALHILILFFHLTWFKIPSEQMQNEEFLEVIHFLIRCNLKWFKLITWLMEIILKISSKVELYIFKNINSNIGVVLKLHQLIFQIFYCKISSASFSSNSNKNKKYSCLLIANEIMNFTYPRRSLYTDEQNNAQII